ncbi:winged helix-turn-helix domain-containing protein [Stenotrophomonas sp. MH1]|uniref:Winged helix-turn-helix domain-containing protein n=1 Tax=Stenotrophomonas capsici TaxID=3110230 RepID=A0ABU5V974_9GAMM|nr:winged helix-turn-helix domain-containing protein [Stenotrophomonas sp. MH1]MEA5669527.1 winged helix-turn-helix domain-containing protein [Stenotrophomonas sp. MH1]
MADTPPAPPLQYRLDDLHIDVARQRVTREDGQLLDVSGLSFRLLHYLLTQGTRVVGFDELIAQVWAPAHVNEETVTQRVRLLRQALGEDGRQPRYLRSVRGQGYQLCSEPSLDAPPPPAPAHARRGLVIAGAIVLLAAAGIAWWQWPDAGNPAHSPLLQRADYYAGIGQRDNNERALALYRQRLQEAPDDVLATLGAARALAARLCLYSGSRDDADQAQAMAEAVIARQPRLAAAHAVLAYAHDCRGAVDAAIAGYERSVQLDPDADASRASAAYLYARQGRLADALDANLAVRHPGQVRFWELQVASNLDLLGYAAAAEARYRRSFQLYPDNVFSNLAWPTFLFEHGRMEEARAALAEARARGTAHAGLHLLGAELALLQGDAHGAQVEAGKARALKPHASLPRTVAWITGAAVRPTSAELLVQSNALREGLQGSDAFDGIDAALLADLAGDRSAALAALQAAVAAGYRDANYLRVSPLLAGLRSDPGFTPVLATITSAVAAERARINAAGRLPADAKDVTATR